MKTKPAMTIGRLARAAGVAVETVRFYEREGLIEQPRRPDSGYRTYSSAVLRRLRFIRRAKALGFTLDETRELLELRVDEHGACGEVEERVRSKIRLLDEKIGQLQSLRNGLEELAAACSMTETTTQTCPVLELLDLVEESQSEVSP